MAARLVRLDALWPPIGWCYGAPAQQRSVRAARVEPMAIARPASTAIPKTPVPAAAIPASLPGTPATGTASAGSHIRRCTYRRVLPLESRPRQLPMYSIDCTHPALDTARPLGDLAAARVACAGCTLPGVFRPDED
jgi:hypothetical protein